jgi:hypothetical protein
LHAILSIVVDSIFCRISANLLYSSVVLKLSQNSIKPGKQSLPSLYIFQGSKKYSIVKIIDD